MLPPLQPPDLLCQHCCLLGGDLSKAVLRPDLGRLQEIIQALHNAAALQCSELVHQLQPGENSMQSAQDMFCLCSGDADT